MAEWDPFLELDDHTINAINQAVGRHNQEMARVHQGSPPGDGGPLGLLSNVGAAISVYLPGILQTLERLAAKGPGMPSIKEFFAEGNAIFAGGETGKPGPAAAEAEAGG